MFKCETIIFYVPLGYIYVLVLFILENIETISITSVTKLKGLNNHHIINT